MTPSFGTALYLLVVLLIRTDGLTRSSSTRGWVRSPVRMAAQTKRMFVVRRTGDNQGMGILAAFQSTRLRCLETKGLLRTAVYDGEVVEKIDADGTEAVGDGEFARVRTSSGEEGLIRVAYLTAEADWEKPWYVQALEEQAERSALRRKEAEAATDDGSLRLLRDALLPLEALLGPGSLVDMKTGAVTGRGWAAVGLAAGAPIYVASVISNALAAGLRVVTASPSPRQQL
jgi:hypothetical protein